MIQRLTERKQKNAPVLDGWVPMPRYLMRRWLVRRLIRDLEPQDFVEIGSASGDMTDWLAQELGMSGTAVEVSPGALDLLRNRFADNCRVSVVEGGRDILHQPTDLVLSMEVLEHIENDDETLADWTELVRPGGYLLLSVPAHPKAFSAEDELAGHFRRYTKQELIEKLSNAGLVHPRILSYGFPIGWLLKGLRTLVANRKLRQDARSRQQRTEASGIERRQWLSLRPILNDFVMLPFNLMQLPFLGFDIGEGYIAIAQKPLTAEPNEAGRLP